MRRDGEGWGGDKESGEEDEGGRINGGGGILGLRGELTWYSSGVSVVCSVAIAW